MHNPWTIARQYYIIDRVLDMFCPRAPKRAPLQSQVDFLRQMTEGDLSQHRSRLATLEARSDAMDVYYLKVIGSALKQHVDQRMDGQDTKLSILEAKSFKGFADNDRRIQDMRESLARSDDEVRRTNSRISAILKQLRNLGENNS